VNVALGGRSEPYGVLTLGHRGPMIVATERFERTLQKGSIRAR
jgi:hypothetical protein